MIFFGFFSSFKVIKKCNGHMAIFYLLLVISLLLYFLTYFLNSF